MTDDAAHFSFARKLASNDLELRTQTLTNLSKFFGKSVNLLKEEDVQKIWMGLFYAMWMSDKPLVQRELSEAISKLVLAHGNADNAILFIKTFYITMHREFPKIDRLRHDKFLKFVRIFVNHSLQFIKQKEYDSEIIEKYIQAQTNIWDVDDAQEIQLHVCDVFFDELFYACGTEIPSAAVFQLAALFADTLTKTNHIILKQRIFEALKALINAASYCSPKLAPKKKHGLETDKDLFPDTEFVNITLTELVDWFMARASTKDKIQNRELLYKLKDEALKKSRAEPGFKLLPRTSIMKTVEDVERDEFKRLMDEHKKVQDALPKEPVLSKKDRKRKRLTDAAKAEGQEVADLITEEENQKKGKKGKAVPVPVPAPAAEETKQNNNKNKKQKVDAPATPTPAAEQNNNNKNKKQKVEAPATPTPAPEETKQNNKSKKAAAAVSPVAAKKKEESAPTITTTVTSTKKQKKNANGEVVEKVEEKVETIVTEDATSKKTEVTSTKAVKKTPAKKGGKKVEEEVVVEKVVEEKKKGKGKKEETEVPEEAPTKKTTKATPVIAPASANGKKRKVEEVVEEPAQNGTPVPAKKGKKGAKSEMVTPQKSEAVTASTPPSTGKKSVRFSKDNHVKEFDKLEAVATTPVTPSATKPKSVLNTPPSKVKVGKKK